MSAVSIGDEMVSCSNINNSNKIAAGGKELQHFANVKIGSNNNAANEGIN